MSTFTPLVAYNVARDLFWAAVAACFLWAIHRIGAGVLLQARVDAYDELRDEYAPEELEQLIHVIKHDSIAY